MACLINEVVGHEKNKQQLLSLISQNRWPHAFLFVGPHSIGKYKTALAFAQALICQESEVSCGTCGPCLRVAKEQSENLYKLSPDTTMAKPVIKVEAVRNVLDSLSLSGLGSARVVLIDQAHRMNAQAANALLKTLEEPFENIYFFLIGPDAQQFLSTIRSRCQIMAFQSLEPDHLKKIKPGLPNWAYSESQGQIEKLIHLTSVAGIERRTESYQLLEQFLADKEFLLKNNWRTQVKDKTWTLQTISAWLQILYIALKSQAAESQNSILLPEQHKTYFQQVVALTSHKLLQLSDDLVSAEKDILGNMDPVLILEKMWVGYARMG